MPTVLFVIPSLHYGFAARQLMLLASGLPRDGFQVRVAVLDTATPWSVSLAAAGVAVEVLGRRRPFDVLPFLALGRLARSMRPDVVHVWGAAALRAVVLSGGRDGSRLLVSKVLPPTRPPGAFDRWLLRGVGGVVAFGAAEAARYRRLGIAVVAPGMNVPADSVKPAELPGVAASDRVVVGLGPIEPHKGFRDAVWAFDIVRHLYDDVHLVLAGSGSSRLQVEHFARRIGVLDRVHFTGACADPAPLLQRADVFWGPGVRGGVCAALEAMAAGRAVVAFHSPNLAEILVHGETGFFVEPGNKAALARQTRLLLDDPAQRRRLGMAGRQRVAEHFSAAQLVQACARLYNTVAGR
jgi:glycosyltransferase involved in cell wall biosynthesis